jgi:UDP-N-acetylglucosamine--N-acetylmuramyl-(pentapeptide) pyrophosphoryl-undecaprenol N-acetylglucosamine transferase
MTAPLIVLAAGGTGGHVFPARALAEALRGRGWRVALVTDRRGAGFGEDLDVEVHRISAASPGGGAGRALAGIIRLGAGLFQARRLLRRLAPQGVAGFGGYPSVPAVWAAASAGLPTLIHEQNAAMGRANRLLAPRVRAIALSFADTLRIRPCDRAKCVLTGNPVRAAVAAVGARPYPALEPDGTLRLLVTGGSQGARILSRVVPEAVAALDAPLRRRLAIVQQCRPEDLDAVRARYDAIGATAELASFFDDMPARLTAAHLVIGRAGASTVAELGAAGRPAVLVPYARAVDDHQSANAAAAEAAGAAWALAEPAFTPQALADRLRSLIEHPAMLTETAVRARAFGRADAAERLADAVATIATPGHNGGSGVRSDERREAAA